MPKKGDVHVVPGDNGWRVEVDGQGVGCTNSILLQIGASGVATELMHPTGTRDHSRDVASRWGAGSASLGSRSSRTSAKCQRWSSSRRISAQSTRAGSGCR